MNSLKKTLPSEDMTEDMKNAVGYGADLGAKTGCLLSVLYSVFFWVVSGLREDPFGGIAFVCLVYPLTLAFVLFLGSTTGAILAWLSRRLSGKVSRQRFVQMGILICIIILAAVYVAALVFYPLIAEQDSQHVKESVEYPSEHFAVPSPLTPVQDFLVIVVLPCIIYVASGGWISHKLWLKA